MIKCDISKVEEAIALLGTPDEERDPRWLERFAAVMPSASFRCENPQIVHDGHGLPYFALAVPTIGVPFDSYCLLNVLEHCTEHGYGVVVWRRTGEADYVFTAGDLVDLRMSGVMRRVPLLHGCSPPAVEVMEGDEVVLSGLPAASVLPGYCRRSVRRFMESIGSRAPGVLLIHRPVVGLSSLVFSMHPDDFDSRAAFDDAHKRLRWLLPSHYDVVLVNRQSPFSRKCFGL